MISDKVKWLFFFLLFTIFPVYYRIIQLTMEGLNLPQIENY